MDLLQLRYFKALAKREQLTQTAKELSISPPSLSATISKLENELGIQLFDHVGRSIRLNSNGKLYLQYVEAALQSLDNGFTAMQDHAGKLRSTISIVLTSLPIWHTMLNDYITSCQDVELKYSVVNYVQLNKTQDYDFFLGAVQDIDTDYFDYRRLMPDERPCVVMSICHPLADRGEINMQELKDETFASLGDANPASTKHLSTLCAMAGFLPKNILCCDYFFREKALAENKCIAVTTNLGYKVNYIHNGSVVNIPLTGTKVIRTQCIAWKKNQYLSRLQSGFIEYLVNYYKEFTFE